MPLDPVTNFALVTVSTGYDSSATSIVLSTGHGARLPSTGGFNLVWWNSTDYASPSGDPNVEIVRCTARTGDTLTVTRAQEGTTATAKNISGKTYRMLLGITKKMIDDIEAMAGITAVVQDTAPQLGGNLDLNNYNVFYKYPLTSNLTSSGLIVSVTVNTNAQGIGAPLYVGSNGQFYAANASSTSTAPAIAIALESGTGTRRVMLHGVLRRDAWSWTTGPGEASLVYLASSAGTLTQTKPSSADHVVQPVGWALSATYLFFCPSLLYFTHTG